MNEFLRQQCFIDGQWLDGEDSIVVINPYDGAEIGKVPSLTANQAATAIRAAAETQPAWADITAPVRGAMLRSLHDAILENEQALAELVTLETGKPITESLGEVRYGATFVDWFAGEAQRMYGETVPAKKNGRSILVMPSPVGVCGMVTPWNFPFAMLARKVAPALAAGCTVVCKPAELTPFSGLAWGVLAEKIGLPKGIVNIVTGDPESIGRVITDSPLVRKFTFTGSTRVGKLLMSRCAGTMKRVSFELGGNAPFIIFEDADMDTALQAALAAKFRNAGQTCVAANRFFVHDSRLAEFTDKIKSATASLKLGNGMEQDTKIGPMISDDAVTKVRGLVEDAMSKGAEKVLGNLAGAGSRLQEPIILTGITNDMRIAQQEIFGPVIAIQSFKEDDDVIVRANDTNYGLAAYVCTNNLSRTMRLSRELEYGMVGFNTGLMSTAEAPFGGVKESGLGREGSRHGIDEFIEMRYVCIDT